MEQLVNISFNVTLSLQAIQELGKMPDPPQITAYIQAQERKAIASMHGFKPGTALASFCSSMEDLYSTSECEVNYIHISAIITALGRIWPAAQRSPCFQQDQPQTRRNAEAVYHQSLKQLQPKLQDIGARAISNIMFSSAKLGFNPDDYVTGMVRTMADRYLQLMGAASRKQRPNAQASANFVWALATMHHKAATDEVLDSVCQYFAGLMHHPDAQQRPTAQNVANVMWALAQMKHSPKIDRLLDHLCMYILSLLQSQDQRARPNEQSVANTLWSLAELKHAPPSEVVSDMLDHVVALCQTPGLQPTPQAISNIFVACAELRLGMRQGQVKVLFKQLLGLPVSQADYQGYCNLAHSLAVMDLLDIRMFGSILNKLDAKHSQLSRGHGAERSFRQLQERSFRQLHQAAEWLKPAEGSEQMEAWSSLHSRMQAVTPAPRLRPRSFPGQAELCDALAKQSLQYKARVPFGQYQADAVLSAPDSRHAQVLLVLVPPTDYLTNQPTR